MTRHKYCCEGRVKTKKDTLSEGVTEKDKRTGFFIEQPGKTQTAKDRSLDGSRVWTGQELCYITFQRRTQGKDQL